MTEEKRFLWTARLFEGSAIIDEQYFPTRAERDAFVAANPPWKKNGKICLCNLDKHPDKRHPKIKE